MSRLRNVVDPLHAEEVNGHALEGRKLVVDEGEGLIVNCPRCCTVESTTASWGAWRSHSSEWVDAPCPGMKDKQ